MMLNREKLEKDLRSWFEWFHAHPELSYEEYKTTDRIREILTMAGVRILPYELETGLVAVVEGEKQGPVQALRCDIDALPVTEQTDLPYISEYQGKMHACGHDFHITVGIGCAILLNEQKSELAGTVKIIFQPGEETALGALKVLETDVMEDVEQIWGIHSDPTNEVGVLGIREGYVAAAADRFVIRIKGVGSHGAHPDDGIDPIAAAVAIVQGFWTIPARNINAFHPALISVARIQAGTTWNVIPGSAELEGTVRTLDREDRVLFEKRVREIAAGVAEAYGTSAEITWIAGAPAVYNDGEMSEKGTLVARECGFQVVPEESSLGGDDFSLYEEKVPGCYIKIGIGKGPTIHQPDFQVDEKAILPAAEYLVRLLMSV